VRVLVIGSVIVAMNFPDKKWIKCPTKV
jgi:hypothetical protein